MKGASKSWSTNTNEAIHVFLDELNLEYFLGGVTDIVGGARDIVGGAKGEGWLLVSRLSNDDETDNGELGKELDGEWYELGGGCLLVRLFSILECFGGLFPSLETVELTQLV